MRETEPKTASVRKEYKMQEIMTDKQIEIILNLVADTFSACKDMAEVKKAISEVREMAKKEKPAE